MSQVLDERCRIVLLRGPGWLIESHDWAEYTAYAEVLPQ